MILESQRVILSFCQYLCTAVVPPEGERHSGLRPAFGIRYALLKERHRHPAFLICRQVKGQNLKALLHRPCICAFSRKDRRGRARLPVLLPIDCIIRSLPKECVHSHAILFDFERQRNLRRNSNTAIGKLFLCQACNHRLFDRCARNLKADPFCAAVPGRLNSRHHSVCRSHSRVAAVSHRIMRILRQRCFSVFHRNLRHKRISRVRLRFHSAHAQLTHRFQCVCHQESEPAAAFKISLSGNLDPIDARLLYGIQLSSVRAAYIGISIICPVFQLCIVPYKDRCRFLRLVTVCHSHVIRRKVSIRLCASDI